VNTVESKRFVGLPIPAAASMVSATVLVFHHYGLSPVAYRQGAVLALIYFLAFLMVSNFRYYSFKDPELIKRQPFGFLVVAVLLLVVIAAEPVLMLFLLFLCYVFSGPVGFIVTFPRRRRLEKALHKGYDSLSGKKE
jgi:CDP-diacylglycerol--serine O-phosphatidyltransferase